MISVGASSVNLTFIWYELQQPQPDQPPHKVCFETPCQNRERYDRS